MLGASKSLKDSHMARAARVQEGGLRGPRRARASRCSHTVTGPWGALEMVRNCRVHGEGGGLSGLRATEVMGAWLWTRKGRARLRADHAHTGCPWPTEDVQRCPGLQDLRLPAYLLSLQALPTWLVIA